MLFARAACQLHVRAARVLLHSQFRRGARTRASIRRTSKRRPLPSTRVDREVIEAHTALFREKNGPKPTNLLTDKTLPKTGPELLAYFNEKYSKHQPLLFGRVTAFFGSRMMVEDITREKLGMQLFPSHMLLA